MALVLLTPPAAPVLTVDEIAEHVRADPEGSPPAYVDATLLEQYVKAATEELDGADGWLGRALITQEWKYTLPRFPGGGEYRCRGGGLAAIALPLPPLQEVISIEYTDADGNQQTLSTDAYRVVTDADPGYVEPVWGATWPPVRAQAEAVAITYRAGYGAAGSDVPEAIRSYIRMRAGQFYEHREMIIASTIINPIPFARDSLERLRVRGVIRS